MAVKKRRYIECPYCKAEYDFAPKIIGKELTCSECKYPFEAIAVKESYVEYMARTFIFWARLSAILFLLVIIAALVLTAIVVNIA